MAKSKGPSYFPFYFELLPTIEDLEADGFKVSIFLKAVCQYAASFQRYDNALDDHNSIPRAVSGTARQAFRTFKAKIDPRLNALKAQGLNSADNGRSGGRPPRPASSPQISEDRVAASSSKNPSDSKPVEPEQVPPSPPKRKYLNRLSKPEQVIPSPNNLSNLNRFPEPELVSSLPSPAQKPVKPEQVIPVSPSTDNLNRFQKPEQGNRIEGNRNIAREYIGSISDSDTDTDTILDRAQDYPDDTPSLSLDSAEDSLFSNLADVPF